MYINDLDNPDRIYGKDIIGGKTIAQMAGCYCPPHKGHFMTWSNTCKDLNLDVLFIMSTNNSRINKKGERRSGDDGNGYINTPDDFWDYGIKHTCFKRTFETTPYCFDDRPFDGDYFLFLYSGIIRGGKFDFHTHNNSREFIKKFLEENACKSLLLCFFVPLNAMCSKKWKRPGFSIGS
jgi:hypothetical protein